MIYKNKPECVTVSTHIPKETMEGLLQMADKKTARDGRWCSLSRLIREILMSAVNEEEQHVKLREMMLREVDHGQRA